MTRRIHMNFAAILVATTGIVAMAGCSPDKLLEVDRPANVANPSTVNNQLGAFALRDGAFGQFNAAFSSVTQGSGLLADEFQQGASVSAGSTDPDTRNLPNTAAGLSTQFSLLQGTRTNAELAIQALKKSAPSAPTSYIANMQAIAGYTRIFLGELFCNGVVINFVPLDGDPIYGTQKTNADLFTQAVAFFDSAIVAGKDTARVLYFAQVGKGRALLDLGKYAEAAAAVANVPTNFVYVTYYNSSLSNWYGNVTSSSTPAVVADNEGLNGLNFRSAADPRLPLTLIASTSGSGRPVNVPTKFIPNTTSLPVATGIEARLIEAEAALQAGQVSTWLTILNTLRTTCTTTVGCATPAPAGTGGVAGLPPLVDPGTTASRIDLMFRERAFWLFGTGHRLGDLRRLIRQYGRDQSVVFPTGAYGLNDIVYGVEVNSPVPSTETRNPNVPVDQVCIDRLP